MQSLSQARVITSSALSQRITDTAINPANCEGPDGAQRASAPPLRARRKGLILGEKGSSLGTTAKCSATPPKIDLETGEITGGEFAYSKAAAQAQRFALQSVARSLQPNSRLAKCLRWRQGGQQVQVLKSIKHQSASYSGLQTCGSVWVCAVCAAKIAERRRGEIAKAIAAHEALGGFVLLLTLTAPHQRENNLVELLEQQATALKFFNKDRSARNVFKEMGCIGQIRALEVTHGRLSEQNNGYHPHYHILLFVGLGGVSVHPDEAQRKDWAVRLYLRWSACCERAGLGTPSYAYGLKLDDGSKAAAYASKWGLEDEMTKGHTKKAIHGETPFDLLRAILADASDKQAAALFIEFAEAFKGKRQLYWSTGLKKRYGIGEASDEELAAKVEDHSFVLGSITTDQWRDVLRVEGRAIVLQLAVNWGWEAVTFYLDSIKKNE